MINNDKLSAIQVRRRDEMWIVWKFKVKMVGLKKEFLIQFTCLTDIITQRQANVRRKH
jgi:hypothetical protein